MHTKTQAILGTLLAATILFGCARALESDEADTTDRTYLGSEPQPTPQIDPQPEQQPGETRTKRRLRVTFMVDTSQSMAVVDPPAAPSARTRATNEVLQLLSARYQGRLLPRAHEDVRYAFITFNDEPPKVNAGITWGFVDDLGTIATSMTYYTKTRGTADHQGALQFCEKLIEHDLASPDNTDDTLARTTHDVILVTDGAPGVVCQEGCGEDEHPLCNKPSSQCGNFWQACYEGQCAPDCYPNIPQCTAYNTSKSLQALVSKITSMSKLARIRLHVVFMAHHLPEFAREQARSLWAGVAAAGNGVYVESNDLSQLSFVDPFGLTAIDEQGSDPTAGGFCTSAEDAAKLDTEKEQIAVAAAAKNSSLGCLGSEEVESCATAKLRDATGLTEDCAACHVQVVICTIDNCLEPCLEYDDPECVKCRDDKCYEAFYACSGFSGLLHK